MSAGVNSTVTSSLIVGLVSQLWLRRRHPGWYKKYNYILGGALDGGAQVMIFVLSFAVFGASGDEKPFPSVRLSLSSPRCPLTFGDSGQVILLSATWIIVTVMARLIKLYKLYIVLLSWVFGHVLHRDYDTNVRIVTEFTVLLSNDTKQSPVSEH